MCWMDFRNAIFCCGFLCARLISVYLVSISASFLCLFCVYISRLPRRGLPRPIYTARAITPLPPLHGYHACVYLSRLPRPSSFFYSWVITPELSRSTTHTRTSGYHTRHDSSYFVVYLSPAYATCSSPPTPPPGRHTYQPTPQPVSLTLRCSVLGSGVSDTKLVPGDTGYPCTKSAVLICLATY